MQGRGMLKKLARVRDNNGALQVRLRLGGRDHFINRIGRFDDPVAQARGQAICADIWRDVQQGDLDLSLNRSRPLVGDRDQDLLERISAIRYWQIISQVCKPFFFDQSFFDLSESFECSSSNVG